MTQLQTIELLNILLEVNNDRIEAYEHASRNITDLDLKLIFARFIITSKQCRDELGHEIIELGGIPSTANSASRKLFNIWMDVKTAFTSNERLSILSSCESAEKETVAIYSKILADELNFLNATHQAMIFSQHVKVKSEFANIISLRIDLEQLN